MLEIGNTRGKNYYISHWGIVSSAQSVFGEFILLIE